MKIVQVNAVYKTKSTGRLMMELHKYFLKKGLDSYAVYATENTDMTHDSHVFRVGSLLDHKIHAIAYRIDNLQGCHSTFATKKFLKKIEKIHPDIVLTHNLHSNFLNVPMFFRGLKDLGIELVVDLHDCWFMTGGCYHYTAIGCDKWLTGCTNCELYGKTAEKKYQINCETFEYVNPTVIATSRWIEREAKRSLLNERSSISMIYDWIDLDTFYPRNGDKVRRKYGINGKSMILGVSSEWIPTKGQREMLELAKAMPDISIVLVGKQPSNAEYPDNVITIAFTDSKDELAELYSAADLLFNPSKQETFGLVSGEALACGTPIIVYNTTACPEFVTEKTGIVMEKEDSIVDAVWRLLEKINDTGREQVRDNCRAFAEENFDINKNIDKYINLFNDLIEKK